MKDRHVVCSCDACALRFEDTIGGRFKLIPRDAVALPEFEFDAALWENFALPIRMVFFFYSTRASRMVALYPSPAGATESQLPLDAWEDLVRANPELARMEPDVQALLVNRLGKEPVYLLAPMDRCYALVGLIRRYWQGLSGGQEVWEKIEAYFNELAGSARSLPKEAAAHA